MGSYIVRTEDLGNLVSRMEETSPFEAEWAIDGKAIALLAEEFRHTKSFYYCDDKEGITVRVYDPRFIEALGRSAQKGPRHVIVKGRNLGKADSHVKQAFRDLFDSIAHGNLKDDLQIRYKEFARLNEEKEKPVKDREAEFPALFQEFVNSYPQIPEGQRHLEFYRQMRTSAEESFRAIVAAAEQGEDVTDGVLLKLLPYSDTAPNREREAWVHIAPSINKDIRKWYGKSGLVKSEEWPKVAEAILRFVRRCLDSPEQLVEACTEFSQSPYAKGFQTGMLTPILNALRPDDYLLINNKSRRVLNYFAETSFGQNLMDYPEANVALHALIEKMKNHIQKAGISEISEADLFDIFSHWLVAIKKYFAKGKGAALFSAKTFKLMEDLHESPTKDFYMGHRDELNEYVINPFKRLLRTAGERLPAKIKARIETRKGLFAKIPKNDWGQGGAWDYYWGAFYPEGGSRTKGAQLSLWMNYERLEVGFYVGAYGDEQRKRFARNCKVHQKKLRALLEDSLSDSRIQYGSHYLDPDAQRVTWQEWLSDPSRDGIDATVVLTRAEVLERSADELAGKVAEVHRSLFPLVILAISNSPIPKICDYLGVDLHPSGEYTLEKCAEDMGFDLETLKRWVRAIERKGQAIFYGPPGTGKTYVAEHLAEHLVRSGDGFREIVQFHPAYAYEDFVQGIRPQARDDGGLDYPLVPGRFLAFCRKAQTREGTCVLIIDEINRANLARVFGELMYLLEYRDREIPLAGGETLCVPPNVRIIGTMNTADRSIALVDHALRRRFAFLHLRPEFGVLSRYHEKRQTGFPVAALVQVLTQLNNQINDPHYEVGISFFLREDLGEQIEDIWRMEIEPYLEEYFFDQADKVERLRWETVSQTICP